MNDFLQYKDYYATIHYSGEDEVFYGKILGINDLVTFEGNSVKDLKSAFKEAIIDYLQTCKDLKKEPEKIYKGSFNVRIPSELHKNASIFAAKFNMSLNEFIKIAIDYTLNKSVENSSLISNAKKDLTLN
jgi:predicted HicB family RNase H-like nuclease